MMLVWYCVVSILSGGNCLKYKAVGRISLMEDSFYGEIIQWQKLWR